MKTTLDAVIALHGSWQNRLIVSGGWYLNQVSSLSFNGNQVCTNSEFVTLVDEMSTNFGRNLSRHQDAMLLSRTTQFPFTTIGGFDMNITKPTYTQAMKDNGELPSVGMEVLYLDSNTNTYIKCEVMYSSEWAIVLKQVGEGYGKDVEIAKHISDVKLKPLTPPIELIDGKAYQFDYNTGSVGMNNVAMRYNECAGAFQFDNHTFKPEHCTNIKLLTVEGES